jgi:DNA processing protein
VNGFGGEGRAVDLGAVHEGAVETEDAFARIAWSALVEPGDSTAGVLVEGLGAARALGLVLEAVHRDVAVLVRACLDAGVVGPGEGAAFESALVAAVARWRPRTSAIDVGAVVAAARRVGAALLVPGDADWPERLSDLGAHAPLVLWGRGRLRGPAAALRRPCLAVVGSRANTLAGAEATAEITSAAADAGCSVISGGAYGIDAVAHRVAIAAGTPTVAVLAGGIDQLYPAGHVELLRTVGHQGLLLAESPPGTRPTRWRFLARNRLIAALGHATVVVEAGARSGALNTAHHAAQLGRPVLAVPGAFSSPASFGCHRLVAQGRAQLAVQPDDPVRAALEAAGGPSVQPEDAVPLRSASEDPEVVRAVDALGRRPAPVTEVARRSGLSVAAATDALALAELQGLVVRRPDGWAAR